MPVENRLENIQTSSRIFSKTREVILEEFSNSFPHKHIQTFIVMFLFLKNLSSNRQISLADIGHTHCKSNKCWMKIPLSPLAIKCSCGVKQVQTVPKHNQLAYIPWLHMAADCETGVFGFFYGWFGFFPTRIQDVLKCVTPIANYYCRFDVICLLNDAVKSCVSK